MNTPDRAGEEVEREALDAYSQAVTTAAARVGPAVVRVEPLGRDRRGGGAQTSSGFIYHPTGLILTSARVARGADALRVTLADGRRLRGEVLGVDPAHDLAVVRVPRKGLPTVKFASQAPRLGQLVVALGNPYGQGWSVTAGVVSALDRSFVVARGQRLEGLLQINIPILPALGGGPLVDYTGRVVGITTAVAPPCQALGFAVPAATAIGAAQSLQAQRRAQPVLWLGVEGMKTAVERPLAEHLQLARPEGVLVLDVSRNSPASLAGLQLLDIIVEVDQRPVSDMQGLAQALAGRQPGEVLHLTVLRRTLKRRVPVLLTHAPPRSA